MHEPIHSCSYLLIGAAKELDELGKSMVVHAHWMEQLNNDFQAAVA
jgi:hypothetical protein